MSKSKYPIKFKIKKEFSSPFRKGGLRGIWKINLNKEGFSNPSANATLARIRHFSKGMKYNFWHLGLGFYLKLGIRILDLNYKMSA